MTLEVGLWLNRLRDRRLAAVARAQAAFQLGKLGRAAKGALGALVEALEDDDSGLRGAATNALWLLHRDGLDVVSALGAVVSCRAARPRTAVALERLELLTTPRERLLWLPVVAG